jgi:hypothetical protein
MSTKALSRWNRGEDPALAKISEASALVSPRGFTASRTRKNRGDIEAVVNEALNTKLSEGLPASAGPMLDREKEELRRNYASFMGDADEFSGKPRGDYSLPSKPAQDTAALEAEKAVQRQGLSAADYWERNPESKRTAVNSRGETVDVMDLSRQYQADRAQENSRQEKFQQALADNRARAAERRKTEDNASADRFAKFVTDIDQRERDKKMAESYLRTFKQQARAARQLAQAGGPREGAEQFWVDNADLQATKSNLARMSADDQLKWAATQVRKQQDSNRRQIAAANSPGVPDTFWGDGSMTWTDYIKRFYGGG